MPSLYKNIITPATHNALLRDIFDARHDLAGLSAEHRLSPAQLAAWINDATNQRCLAGLCRLADLQAQLMLSRYRQLAVSELIRQATYNGNAGDDASTTQREQARKACVDLLRADLKRAHSRPLPARRDEDLDDAVQAQSDRSLRELFYRLSAPPETPPEAESPASGGGGDPAKPTVSDRGSADLTDRMGPTTQPTGNDA